MGQMTKEEIEAAMDQITNCVVSVKVPRLTAGQIEELTRPKKRRAKKRYSTLDFSDDRSYFQKACSEEIYYPKKKRNYTYTRRRKKMEKEEPPKVSLSSYLSASDIDEKPSKKFNPFFNEMGILRIKEEVDPSSSTFFSPVKIESDQPKSTIVWKIRIKSAYELGSNIMFVDISYGSATGSNQPALSHLIASEAEPKLMERTKFATKFDIHTISSLYKELFTNENRIIIKKVAEALLNLTESIKRKNDKLTEINCSRSTDAEKLMLRHQAHGEFNRFRDANQIILKNQFEVIGHSFRHENFEIRFQLFFLGIMKTLIVSMSNKKGTLFKKIVSLLSQSLSSCNYQNERILNLLRSKDFRADCATLLDFLEKCSETKSFDMVFISEADKKILRAKNFSDRVDMSESSSKPSLLSVNAKIPSIVRYSVGMKILPVGSNLLLQSVNSSSTIQPKVNLIADINVKKSKITSALLNSVKGVKFAPVNQSAPKNKIKKPFPQPNFTAVTNLPYSASNHNLFRTKSATILSTGPPSYSVGSSIGTVSFSAINALPNSTLANTSVQSMSHLVNSNSNTQPGGGFTNLNSSIQPMCPYPAQSSSIQTSCTFTNYSSMGQSNNSYVNSNSSVQPVSTLTNSSSGTNTVLSNCHQPAPLSSTTVPTSSYPFVMQTNLPPAVPTYTPNAVLNSSHTNGRPHSVIVTSSNLAASMSHSTGPPSYTVTNIGATARGIVQPSPPLPQLLPPAVPSIQPQLEAVSAHGMMQSSSPVLQLLLPTVSDLPSQPGEDMGGGIMQPSSPLAQLQPPAVPNMLFQSSAEPAAAAVRGIMQSSPPLPELLPPAVPNIQTQPVGHAFVNTTANEASAQNCEEMSLAARGADNRSEFALRTYSSAKEVNKRAQIPSPFHQDGMVSEFHQSRCSDNPVLGSVASAGSPHHFIVPEPFGSGIVSAPTSSSQTNGPYSPYRTISPAGNCENIQPHSPHSLLHQNTAESGSTLLKDSSYTISPTTNSNEGLTLRSLLMDHGRAPLVNQNGPVEAPFQYAEKVNFSLDLPPVLSPEAITNVTLATSHFPMVNYVGNPYS